MSVMDVMNRKAVRAWVQFEQRDKEDKMASAAQGKYVGVDEDFVIITPAYGKDDVHKTVVAWKDGMATQLAEGKIGQEDLNYYLARYDAWKKGLDMPLDGTPIKTWGAISPSQQKLLISVGILTVEDLSQMNDEGVRRIGMGAVELRRKANAWIAQLNDKGQLTQKMAGIESENDLLKGQVATLTEQVNKLMAMVPKDAGQKAR